MLGEALLEVLTTPAGLTLWFMSSSVSLHCPPLLPLSKLSAAADERELFRFTYQSFRAFKQEALAKACEKSFTTRELSQGAESEEKEGNGSRHVDASVLAEVSDAMATGLQDHVIACARLEEAVDR